VIWNKLAESRPAILLTYVLGIDIIGARLDGYAVVSSLVVQIRQHDVVRIHGIEAIGVLDPILAKRRIDSSGVVHDIIEPHMSAIHNIQGP
jgi:hypothetical protein